MINAQEHGQNMLIVISILAFITVFIGGVTKNPLTSPFSFLLFSDSIFVNNYNFYFTLFENFIDFYEKIHEYVFNYIKWILFFKHKISSGKRHLGCRLLLQSQTKNNSRNLSIKLMEYDRLW